MDATFYDDLRPRGNALKRPMTLDLEPGRAASLKKQRVVSAVQLTSPDLNMLKLASPELEKLIMAQHQGGPQGGPCMYPKGGDDREQPYANRDFVDALSSLQHGTNLYQPLPDMGMGMPPCSTATMVDSSYGYPQQQQQHHHQQQQQQPQQQQQQPLSSINLNCSPLSFGYYEPLVSIKEEPQTVPCLGSPPQSPIDMEAQERMKLERKRLRNRIAASKCRRRKLERIARLEDKVTNLKNENTELTNHVTRLRECICQLKEQVMNHVRSGCEMMVNGYINDM